MHVTNRLKDHQGNPIGTSNSNTVLYTWTYEVDFSHGHKKAMAANVIADHMFASINKDGHRYLLLGSIIDYLTSGDAVRK